MAMRVIAVVIAFLSSLSAPITAQRPSGTTPELSTLSGTLSDPFGAAAENTAITLVGLDSFFAVDVRTDTAGRFQFPPIAPGRYVMRAPTSDAIAPSVVTLVPGARVSLDARLVVEEVAVVFRICRECEPADYKLPDLVKRESGSQRDASTAIVHPAEPEEGWIAFNERPLPYPAAIRTTRLEGTVMIDGTVTPEGTTATLRVVSSTNPRLTELALPLVQAQRWKAARVRSTPVEAPLHVTVEFSLYGD
jgi:TonB family protein